MCSSCSSIWLDHSPHTGTECSTTTNRNYGCKTCRSKSLVLVHWAIDPISNRRFPAWIRYILCSTYVSTLWIMIFFTQLQLMEVKLAPNYIWMSFCSSEEERHEWYTCEVVSFPFLMFPVLSKSFISQDDSSCMAHVHRAQLWDRQICLDTGFCFCQFKGKKQKEWRNPSPWNHEKNSTLILCWAKMNQPGCFPQDFRIAFRLTWLDYSPPLR